jgi:hypothetical protein
MNGHVRIPHDWVQAWRHDHQALLFLLVFSHDEWAGTQRTVRGYAAEFGLRRDKVSRLMQKWRNHCLEAAGDSVLAESDKAGQESDKTPPQVPEIDQLPEVESDKSRTLVGQESDTTYLYKTETETETREESPDAERLTLLFADTLASAAEEHGISRRKQARPPKAWFTEMDRLLRLDGIPAGVVESVLLWAITESDFWGTGCGQGVLQSVPKLRKHWDIIASQRAEAQPRERFDVAKRVLAESEGGKRGHRRESVTLRLLGK